MLFDFFFFFFFKSWIVAITVQLWTEEKKWREKHEKKELFIDKSLIIPKEENSGIPVIKSTGSSNKVVNTQKTKEEDSIFPKLDLDKKESIFPKFTDIETNNSFFDESEFDDLKDYIEDDKKGWF